MSDELEPLLPEEELPLSELPELAFLVAEGTETAALVEVCFTEVELLVVAVEVLETEVERAWQRLELFRFLFATPSLRRWLRDA